MHKLLNDKVDELSNIVHDDPDWQARDGVQAFNSTPIELIRGGEESHRTQEHTPIKHT